MIYINLMAKSSLKFHKLNKKQLSVSATWENWCLLSQKKTMKLMLARSTQVNRNNTECVDFQLSLSCRVSDDFWHNYLLLHILAPVNV